MRPQGPLIKNLVKNSSWNVLKKMWKDNEHVTGMKYFSVNL